MVFETVDECVEGTLRSSHERSGVCFGGFRPTKHVEEPRLRAVTPACAKPVRRKQALRRAGTGFSMWWLHFSHSHGVQKNLAAPSYTNPNQTFNYFWKHLQFRDDRVYFVTISWRPSFLPGFRHRKGDAYIISSQG